MSKARVIIWRNVLPKMSDAKLGLLYFSEYDKEISAFNVAHPFLAFLSSLSGIKICFAILVCIGLPCALLPKLGLVSDMMSNLCLMPSLVVAVGTMVGVITIVLRNDYVQKHSIILNAIQSEQNRREI